MTKYWGTLIMGSGLERSGRFKEGTEMRTIRHHLERHGTAVILAYVLAILLITLLAARSVGAPI